MTVGNTAERVRLSPDWRQFMPNVLLLGALAQMAFHARGGDLSRAMDVFRALTVLALLIALTNVVLALTRTAVVLDAKAAEVIQAWRAMGGGHPAV